MCRGVWGTHDDLRSEALIQRTSQIVPFSSDPWFWESLTEQHSLWYGRVTLLEVSGRSWFVCESMSRRWNTGVGWEPGSVGKWGELQLWSETQFLWVCIQKLMWENMHHNLHHSGTWRPPVNISRMYKWSQIALCSNPGSDTCAAYKTHSWAISLFIWKNDDKKVYPSESPDKRDFTGVQCLPGTQ